MIPKKSDARKIGEYRPINLTHSVAKIVSKLLATRLAPFLQHLISRAQSAFIKKRSIHDNFIYTQNLVQCLHRQKIPALFLKLDISKAFDSVRWDYLMEVLEKVGFGVKWRSWVTTLISTASTSVLLNGGRGKWFKHKVGLRQGDPLSPMLFILAMEPLQCLLNCAAQEGALTEMGTRSARLRISLYADDAAIFLKPNKEEMQEIRQILTSFGMASGLLTNIQKSAVYPICCANLNIAEVIEGFDCPIKDFPCTC